MLLESGPRAQLATWRLDVRPRAADCRLGDRLPGLVDDARGLFKLTLNTKRQIAVKDLVVSAEDITLTVPEGILFVAETDAGPTAIVVLGRGEVVFSPAPPPERSQLRVLTGSETLQSGVDGAFLRVFPGAFEMRVKAGEMADRPVDPRELKRAEEIFRQDVAKSFCLELGDLSGETWSLLPSPSDFLAEIRTRRFDTLTYARSSSEIEDVSLFDRKARTESLHLLVARAPRPLFALLQRGRQGGLPGAFLRSRRAVFAAHAAAARTGAAVGGGHGAFDDELHAQTRGLARRAGRRVPRLGRLLTVRVRDQNSIVVNLPTTLVKGFRLNLEVLYTGRLEPQAIDRESIQVEVNRGQQVEEDVPLEESYLFSNRSFWYPHPEVLGYADAESGSHSTNRGLRSRAGNSSPPRLLPARSSGARGGASSPSRSPGPFDTWRC